MGQRSDRELLEMEERALTSAPQAAVGLFMQADLQVGAMGDLLQR